MKNSVLSVIGALIGAAGAVICDLAFMGGTWAMEVTGLLVLLAGCILWFFTRDRSRVLWFTDKWKYKNE
jgi:hypothetical protein